jgi:hypothetical protein
VSLDCAVQGRNEVACGRCSGAFVIPGGDVEADEVVRDCRTAGGEICDRIWVSEGMSGVRQQPDVGGKSEGEGQTCYFLSAFTARAFLPGLTRDCIATNESETQCLTFTDATDAIPAMHPQSNHR